MFKTFINAFKVKDVRRKIFYVLMMLVVIRLGSQMPVPGVNTSFFANYFANNTNEAFSFLNAFTGGGFDRFSIFALSITPYITSSIIIQLLTIAIPRLEEMQRDGEEGRKKMTAITRYVTVGLALFESVAMAVGFGRQGLLTTFNAVNVIVVVAALTAGSAFLMWVGEQINDKGVGNGISMVLLINILSRIPQDMVTLYETFVKGKTIARGLLMWIIIAVVIIAVVVLVLILNGAERRIPVQYYSCNHCWNGTVCCILTGRREKNSGTVFQENGRKKNGWRTVIQYSAEGKYSGRYPDHLCIIHHVFPIDYPVVCRKVGYQRYRRNADQDAEFQQLV